MIESGQGSDGSLWRLSAEVADEASANAVAASFASVASAVSAFEARPGGAWKVEAYAELAPDRAALDAAGALAAIAFGVEASGLLNDVTVQRLAPRDWVRENQQSFPPIRRHPRAP
jgi:ribosomal protein L11 methyltransferase